MVDEIGLAVSGLAAALQFHRARCAPSSSARAWLLGAGVALALTIAFAAATGDALVMLVTAPTWLATGLVGAIVARAYRPRLADLAGSVFMALALLVALVRWLAETTHA
ncbi:MAG: hypothetical protein AAGN82_32480 [Myxococcota bacterium]